MASEDVELIRSGYEAMNRRDFDAALERVHPQAVWENDVAGPRGATTYVGPSGFKRFWEEFLGLWERFHFEPVEFVEGSDGRIAARVRLTVWSAASDQPVLAEHTYVWSVSDGRILGVRLFFDLDRALAEAGVPADRPQ